MIPLNRLKTDIPKKIIKKNSNIFASFIRKTFNNMVNSSTFSAAFKLAHITPAFKKGSKNLKENYIPVSILPIFQKSMKDASINKYLITSETFSLNSSASFAKVLVGSTVF